MLYRNQVYTISETLLYGDMVFYGGLYGAIITGNILLRYKFFWLGPYEKYIIMSIPLFHAISRLGCYFSGCCYGIEINDTKIPVQLIEALCELIIFFIISYSKESSNVLVKYIVLYGINRFFLEFLRGDIERGIIYYLSVSQWLSLINLLVCIILIVYTKIKEMRHNIDRN